jgi:uncharacterized membrane protein YukC
MSYIEYNLSKDEKLLIFIPISKWTYIPKLIALGFLAVLNILSYLYILYYIISLHLINSIVMDGKIFFLYYL